MCQPAERLLHHLHPRRLHRLEIEEDRPLRLRPHLLEIEVTHRLRLLKGQMLPPDLGTVNLIRDFHPVERRQASFPHQPEIQARWNFAVP